MKTPSVRLAARIGLCLAALVMTRLAQADEDNIRVSVVVDTTDEGDRQPKPNPEHPIYYYPWTAGYVELGGVLRNQKPPPPAPEVQHLIAKALAERGFRYMNKAHPPSIVLVLWWGYIDPIVEHRLSGLNSGDPVNEDEDSIYLPGIGISANVPHIGDSFTNAPKGATAAQVMGMGAWIPLGAVYNFMDEHEAFLMVAGERFQEDLGRVSADTDEIHQAATHPRYFLMVSALDFQAAIHHKSVLLWCARVSTELQGRDLKDVLPQLISTGTQYFGEDTGHPKFVTAPAGHVEFGTPTLKASYPAGK